MLDARQHIRILELPAMRVAAIRCTSASPETDTLNAIVAFAEQHRLMQRKPDVRHFGYTPRIKRKGNADIDSFVRMVSIPEEIEVAAPFEAHRFPGGLYAACTVPISFFDKISELRGLVRGMSGYELEHGAEYHSLEEYLNGWLFSNKYADRFFIEAQVDLMVPVRKQLPG